MKRYFYYSFIWILLLSGFETLAQPTFSLLTVNSINTQATVIFNSSVYRGNNNTLALTPSEFTVSISASANGGSVTANSSLSVTVTHTANTNTATLAFTIPNASTADGSEILTVKPSSSTAIYNSTGAMLNSATITTNLKDLFIPIISSITRQSPTASFTNAPSVTFRVTFNEAVANVTLTDFVKSGTASGTLSTVNTINASTYDVVLTGVSGNGNLNLDIAGGQDIADLAGNLFAGSITSEQEYTIDNIAPTVVLSSNDADAIVRDANTVTITANFTEANGLSGTPTISIPTSTTPVNSASMTGGPLVWTYSWNVPTGAVNDGNVNISVSAVDNASNPSAAATGVTSYTIDNTLPSMTSIVPAMNPTRGIISRPGTITSNTGSAIVTGVGTSFTTQLFVGARLRSTADNDIGTVLSIDSDTQVTLDANAVTAVSGGGYAIRLYFTATFNEPIVSSSIITSDFTVTGIGGISSVFPVTAGAQSSAFYVMVNGLFGNNGTCRIDLTNNGYTDVAGNSSTATYTSGTIATIDNAGPTVSSIVRKTPTNAYTQATSVTYTVTFSEAVTGVDDTDFTKTISGAGFTTGAVTVSPVSSTVYDVTVASIATVNGTLRLDVPGSASITDALGNAFNTAFTTGQVYTFDYTPPSAPVAFNAVTTVGTIVANYWNGTNEGGTNAGLNLSLSIPNDASLSGGTIQVEARISSGTFATITPFTSLAIAGGDLGNNKIITIDDSQILAIIGYAQGVSLQFRARYTDLAGNTGSYTQSTNSLFVDTVVPTIFGTPQYASNGSNTRETISITFSETLYLTSGETPIVTTTNGNAGFYSNQGAVRNGGASDFTALGITLESNSNDTWNSNVQITYTKSNSTNLASNFVRDVAGNEMNTISFTPNSPPPVLASSMVLSPSGSGVFETITFTVDQGLNTPTTAGAVTGLTVNGISFPGTYSTTGNVITITSTLDGQWDETATVSYSGGNIANASSVAMIAFGPEKILLGPIGITSNNANTTLAKVGDQITVAFKANNTLLATPTATIGGLTATVGGVHPNYTATITTDSTVPDGAVLFSIVALETNRTTTVSITIPGSSVLFDKIQPTVVLSDNHADNIVRDADIVTITATFTELNSLNGIPTISISQTSPAISNASMTASANPLIWVYSWDVPAGAVNDGPVNVTIATTDPAGNANTAATGKTSYTIDNTPPTVTIATSSALLGFGTNGTTATSVNFLLTFSGTVPTAVLASDISVNTGNDINIFDAYPGVGFTALVDGNITGSGTTRTVNVTGLSGTGWLKINLNDADNTVTDVAGNPAVDYFTSFTFPGTEAYTRVLPQPSNPITSPTTTRTGTTLTVNWSDAFAPAQQATHYLVMIKKTTVGAFPSVTDGTFIVNDFDLTDNILKQNITFGSTIATFTGLPLTDTYDVIIYPYTLSPNNGSSNINFGTATQVSGSSDIIQNFNYTGNDNILYKDFVELILTSSSKTLEVFDLRDGGGSADADALPTILSGITLNITNWENLNQLGLFNGATLVQQVAVTGPTITFNSLGSTFQAADDGSATITVKGSFKTIVDDNEVVTFSVSSVSASTVSSSQFLTTTPTGATVTSDATGTQNKIEVVATRIDFTTVPASASISVPLTIQVSARDANANLDADYNGSITATSNTNTGSFTTANDPTGAFTGGIKDYPVNFQFTTGNGSVQLTINSGAGSGAGNINAAAISGTSPVLSVISSFDSWLYFDPSFAYSTKIDFANKQEDPIVGTSQPLARLILSDGGSATSAFNLFTNPNPGLKNQATHQDSDGSFTKIDAFTISLTNFQDIRKIALYASDGVTKIGTDKTPAATVIFTGLSAYFAPDNGTYTYYIRASFNQTVTDLDQVAIQVTAVTHNSGSKFSEQQTIPPPTIAGVDGAGAFGDSSPLTNGTGIPLNVLDVIATSLDFTTQPSAYAGINEPLTVNGGNAGIVKSRDQFANLDTEFNYSFMASTPQAGINSSSLPTKFVNGVLDLGVPGMRYTSPGDGTITIEANGISSSVSSSPNKIICSKVDVIHVEGTYTSTGVLTSSNIAGGSVNKVIYGVTFDAPYKVSGGEPSLTKFIISFDNPINVLKSYRVFESRNGNSYDGNDISVTTFGGTVTANNTSRTVTVDFTAAPRDFQTVGDPVNKRLSYFLMVDVEATASGSTLPITPTVIDQGYAFPSTDSNILTSKGSSTANAQGKKFTFASIFPPTLVASNPAVGKLNIDPNKLTIDLAFSVPVWTLDRKINLYDKTAGTPPITLNAINGFFDNTLTGGPDNATNKATLTGDKLATPLSFAIPSGTLIPDHVYYVLIPSGVNNGVNQPGNTGIMDESGNLFQGISYYGTLYFKTANPTPPVLLADPSPSITDIFSNGATINTTFDQTGKAYFMVVKSTDPMPTNGQIAGRRNDYTGTVIDRGFYSIDKIKPISQFGLTRSDLYTPSTNYNVWIYAENDANPKPIASKGPYGSSASNFAALDTLTAPSTSPATLSFKTSALPVGSGVLINTPTVSICKDSYQFINQPITIYEKTTGDFSAGNVDQVFNLLLPTGYQFDVTLDGSNKPVYGTMTLSGRDAYNPTGTNNTGFVDGFGKLQFINSSTLRVTYRNNGGNTFLDDITISGLKVISTTTLGGRIERLGGNALVATIPDGTALAKLASSVPEGIDFSNSYSEINFPTNLTAINSIPDNFNEPSLLVTLIPEPPVGDYGADSFSGQGVNVDQLSLASVTINSPFNITLTHTDNNGCISQNSLQYTIYDHTTAIRDLSIKYGIYNPNFISSTIKSPAPTGVQKDTVFYTNLPAYFMYTVTADTLRGTKQFISGKAWADVLASLPNIISTTPDPNNTGGAADRFYNTYSLDWATILNAEFSKVDSTLNPYLNRGFRQTTNTNYDYEFFTGGSLGIVEFNADYQSIANASVQLPLKQNVEFFLNPIPVVEVYNPSDVDVNDTNNLPFTNSNSGPPSNLGTLIFCEGGGKISISGFPKATSGSSKGFFVLIDVVSGDTIYYDHPTNSAKDKLPAGFKDFGSGDAELTPNLIINGYQDIKISYTYQDDNSPISGSSYQIIRVTPNPKASFSASSIVASNNVANVKLRTLPDGRPSTFSSYCEDNLISFNNTAQFLDKNSLPVAGYTAQRNPVWVMGDPLNSRNRRDTITDNGVLTLADSVIFKYSDIGTYQVEFSVESQYGCRSNVYSSSVTVGEIPKPGFDITGLSTATPIVVTNTTKSSIPPNGSITTNSGWNFGDPYQPDLNLMVFGALNTNTYPKPGHYTVTLKATTTAGCEISYQRPVIIVPAVTLSATQTQTTDDFESNIQTKQWQTSSTDTLKSSWVRGVSKKDSLRLKTNVWITKIKDDYNPNEESYLYSPVYDLSSLARPMISFDQAANLAKNDGVTLEFSVDDLNVADSTKKWYRLGIKGEGTNWYDEAGLASKPGDQFKYPETIISSGDYGWSRKDSSSRSSRHALSPDLPSKSRVVFRFALSSVSGSGDQGFALDNFRIGDRTRTVLIENFTNKGTSNADEKAESDYLKNDFSANVGGLNAVDFIKINYHVGFPGVDPFNTTNPADPSARALYYNVSKTPTAFMDSYDDPFPLNSVNRLFSKWGGTKYGSQSLELAGADITITATLLPSNTYSVSVSVTAKKDLPASTVLHTGFLEAKIISTSALIKTGETEFEYVLKKLLPSAAGTRFGTPLAKDQTKIFGPFEWTVDPGKLFPNANDLAAVAFLQDESTKEVHQSALKSGLTDPSLVTGIEAILPEQVNVYPNPASSEFKVELPSIVQNEVKLHLIDMTGRKYEKGMIPSGGNSATVNVEDLSEGIYILEIGNGNTGIIRKKIMVVMKN